MSDFECNHKSVSRDVEQAAADPRKDAVQSKVVDLVLDSDDVTDELIPADLPVQIQTKSSILSLSGTEEDDFLDTALIDMLPEGVVLEGVSGNSSGVLVICPEMIGTVCLSAPADSNRGPTSCSSFICALADRTEVYVGNLQARLDEEQSDSTFFDVVVDCRIDAVDLGEKRSSSAALIKVPITFRQSAHDQVKVARQAVVKILKVLGAVEGRKGEQRPKRVLIHCLRGRDRSAFICRALISTLDPRADLIVANRNRPAMRDSFPLAAHIITVQAEKKGLFEAIRSFGNSTRDCNFVRSGTRPPPPAVSGPRGIKRSPLEFKQYDYNYRILLYNPDSFSKLSTDRGRDLQLLIAKGADLYSWPEGKYRPIRDNEVHEAMGESYDTHINHAVAPDKKSHPGIHGTAVSSLKESIFSVAHASMTFNNEGRVTRSTLSPRSGVDGLVPGEDIHVYTVYAQNRAADPDRVATWDRTFAGFLRGEKERQTKLFGGGKSPWNGLKWVLPMDGNAVISLQDACPEIRGTAGATPADVSAMKVLMEEFGLVDVWSWQEPSSDAHYSSFFVHPRGDYVRCNRGYRLCYFLVSKAMLPYVACNQLLYGIHRREGDHVPILLDFLFPLRTAHEPPLGSDPGGDGTARGGSSGPPGPASAPSSFSSTLSTASFAESASQGSSAPAGPRTGSAIEALSGETLLREPVKSVAGDLLGKALESELTKSATEALSGETLLREPVESVTEDLSRKNARTRVYEFGHRRPVKGSARMRAHRVLDFNSGQGVVYETR